MSDQFICSACHERFFLAAWCAEDPEAASMLCVRCCPCPSHLNGNDPGGHAVLAGEPLTWRGLHDSEARTRRHQ